MMLGDQSGAPPEFNQLNKIFVSIVHNSVSRDTRVIKEAIALSEDLNCSYTIVGIADTNDSRKENDIAPNVKVVRIKVPNPRDFLVGGIRGLLRSKITLLLLLFYCLVAIYFNQPFFIVLPSLFLAFLFSRKFLKRFQAYNRIRLQFKLRYLYFFLPEKLYSELRVIFLSYLRYQQFSREFFPTLEDLGPDVIHAHDAPMLVVATWYKRFYPNTKIVFDAHEIYEHMSGRGVLFQKFFNRYINYMAKDVDAFITINESIKDYHKKNLPRLPEAYIVKNATSKELLKESVVKSNLIREKIGIPDSKNILLYQGGFSVARGLDRIIKASELIDPSWVIVFMGWGSNEAELREEAEKLNLLGTRIHFIPPAGLQELTAWTSGADVGIIPYLNTCLNHYYCTPNKLWEYPVARLPIIVPDYPELANAVDSFGIGWKIDDMEPSSIAKIVNSITKDSITDKLKNIERYFDEESWEVYRINLVKAYRQII